MRRRVLVLAPLVAGVASLAVVAGLTSGSSAQATVQAPTGTVTMAMGAGAKPDYIFPITDGAHYSTTNIEQFQRLMFRPLYWIGKNGSPVLDTVKSLANPPVYSNGNKQVSITIKNYNWSDGKPVSARDLTFLLNLLKYNKKSWAGYLPGYLPDSIAKVTVKGQKTVVLTMKNPVSPAWFTGNQLSQLIPMPQHAWDKKSASGAIGNYDTSAAGATAVFTYLMGETKKTTAYATNKLWQIVDGPWKLSQYRTDGYSAFVPNPKYSGPDKPTIAKFIETPFTTETAELNALRSGNTITYGYVPLSEAALAPALAKQKDFQLVPWVAWGFNFFPYNFRNPASGKIFKQLYFRQAFQSLINQPGYIKALLKGYGTPVYGPVPQKPANPYVSADEKNNPYPYSPDHAKELLSDHGWDVNANGVTTCKSAGTGPSNCGEGIDAGTKLEFALQYASGTEWVAQSMQALQSVATQVGIKLDLSTAPFNTIIANAGSCNGGTSCTWDIVNWGGGWIYGVNPVPTGDQIFLTGAGGNFGGYSDPTNDANIKATTQQGGTAPIVKYQNYLAKQLPVVFMPFPVYQLSLISSKLKGVTPQIPILGLAPEDWRLSS